MPTALRLPASQILLCERRRTARAVSRPLQSNSFGPEKTVMSEAFQLSLVCTTLLLLRNPLMLGCLSPRRTEIQEEEMSEEGNRRQLLCLLTEDAEMDRFCSARESHLPPVSHETATAGEGAICRAQGWLQGPPIVLVPFFPAALHHGGR